VCINTTCTIPSPRKPSHCSPNSDAAKHKSLATLPKGDSSTTHMSPATLNMQYTWFRYLRPVKTKRKEKKTNNHVSPPHLNGATDRSDIVEEQITYIFPPLSLGFNRNDVNAFPPENTWQHTNKKKTKQHKKHQQNKRWLYKKEPKYKWLYPAPQCVLGTMLGRASTLRGKNSPTPHFL
jgi:hypothetical protein